MMKKAAIMSRTACLGDLFASSPMMATNMVIDTCARAIGAGIVVTFKSFNPRAERNFPIKP